MSYDFTSILAREGKDSIAANHIPIPGAVVREGFSRIPMWVADMSFPTAPEIVNAMRERLEFPFFGYYTMPEAYYRSIIRWHQRRHGTKGLLPEHIGYENGVLGGVSTAIQMLSCPGEKLLLHSPTYVGFTHVLHNIGRSPVHSELRRDDDGIWRMDYEDMEKKLREEKIHLAILCSPHNPCGRVWERWELERAMELFRKYEVTVISDEIWSDIVMAGYTHIPTQNLSEDARMRTLSFYSPSKTFSLAGLVGSYHIVYNPALRDRLRRRSEMSHYNAGSVLSMRALIAAYDEAEGWADEMIRVVDENFRFACAFIAAHFPGVRVMRPQGTYMLFLDCGDWLRAHHDTLAALLRRGAEVGVLWQNGEDFLFPDSIRLNLSLPRTQLEEAMRRLDEHVFR